MARLLDILMRVDNLARLGVQGLGTRSDNGRALRAAAADLRRELGARALAETAAHFDPKTDLMDVLAAAEAAGLSWPDMADALNRYHERQPRRAT